MRGDLCPVEELRFGWHAALIAGQKAPQLFDRRHDDDSVAPCVLLEPIANKPKGAIDSTIVKHTIEVAARTTASALGRVLPAAVSL